jgi:hypothetical protein
MPHRSSDSARIAENLTVPVKKVLDGEFDSASYPYQHLAVQERANLGVPETLVPRLMVAVEILGRAGWELVCMTQVGDRSLVAALRRRLRASPPE